jgi:hypothetical protein
MGLMDRDAAFALYEQFPILLAAGRTRVFYPVVCRQPVKHGVGHQLHTVMSLLFELKAQQQPLELIFPREGSRQA